MYTGTQDWLITRMWKREDYLFIFYHILLHLLVRTSPDGIPLNLQARDILLSFSAKCRYQSDLNEMHTKTSSLGDPDYYSCNLHRHKRMRQLRAVINNHPHDYANCNSRGSNHNYPELCIYSGEYHRPKGNYGDMGKRGFCQPPDCKWYPGNLHQQFFTKRGKLFI